MKKAIKRRKISKAKSARDENVQTLLSYVKENWKTILSEVLIAGMAAYKAHGAKSRNQQSRSIS